MTAKCAKAIPATGLLKITSQTVATDIVAVPDDVAARSARSSDPTRGSSAGSFSTWRNQTNTHRSPAAPKT